MEIVYTELGLANRFSNPDQIEINKHLKKEPELLAQILKHELGHTDKTFSAFDLKHDLTSGSGINNMKLFMFMLKHPKTFLQFSPMYYSKSRKKIIYDLNLGLYYLILIGLFGIGLLIVWLI